MNEQRARRERRETAAKGRVAASSRKPGSANGKPGRAPEQPPEPPTELKHPAVLVVRVPGEQPGQENIQITPINMDPLAVPTLLSLAIRIQRQNLGLTD